MRSGDVPYIAAEQFISPNCVIFELLWVRLEILPFRISVSTCLHLFVIGGGLVGLSQRRQLPRSRSTWLTFVCLQEGF